MIFAVFCSVWWIRPKVFEIPLGLCSKYNLIFLEPSRSIKKWYSWYCHWWETLKRRSWYWKWFSYLKSTSSTKKFLPWNGLLATILRIYPILGFTLKISGGKFPLIWLWTSSIMFKTSSKLHWRSTECMLMFSAVFNQCL